MLNNVLFSDTLLFNQAQSAKKHIED